MRQNILDYQAQHYLRRWIRDLPSEQRHQLRNVAMCNEYVSAVNGQEVYLMADGEGHSKYVGLATCKNPFCCPVCSALMMEKYRSHIATAIEMLKPKYFGFMVTLTMPHLGFMGWRETTDILYDTWKYFHIKSFQRSHGHAFHEFSKEVPCDNWVRVAEYTWSEKNGAHPHFHSIWWTPRGNEGKVLDWEDRLNEFWLKTVRRIMIRYWKRNKLHESLLVNGMTYEKLADRVFYWVNKDPDCKFVNKSVYFSRDKEGNLREVETSDYIGEWGADRELTGNVRKEASHNGHYTPYQILMAGFNDVKMRKVYLDFSLAVTRKPVHHRVNFSKNGLFKLVQEYERTHETESTRLEKKSSRNWKVVCWFTEEQWYGLLDLEFELQSPITSDLLYLASQDKEVLLEYMDSLGLQYETNLTRWGQIFAKSCCSWAASSDNSSNGTKRQA